MNKVFPWTLPDMCLILNQKPNPLTPAKMFINYVT